MPKRVKIAKKEHLTPTSAGISNTRRYYVASSWRNVQGTSSKYEGLHVFIPTDPYSATERKEFRTAVENPYVYKAIRTSATMTVGQGFTTSLVPREEEEIPAEQREAFNAQIFHVPYFNKKMTGEQILDYVDRLSLKLDLQTNIFNAFTTEMEQGRAVLALLPLNRNDDGKYTMPQQIKLVRPEHTLRPIVDQDNGELVGCQITGAKTPDGVVPVSRIIYFMNGYNNELFSDFFGDSKVARISDLANSLNIILTQDYPNTAKNVWFKPRVWAIPIPPQEYGNEKSIISQFMGEVNNSEGKDVGVTGPSNKDDIGVQVVGGEGGRADVSGLEVIRQGVVKAIITSFGIPSFILDEGDFGPLGGNAQITQLDTYINTEVRPERQNIENILEKQYYDRILCVLFDVEKPDAIPIKIKHHFNKPKLWTLMSPEMFGVFMQMLQAQLIDADGIRDMLGLDEFNKETMALGNDASPQQQKVEKGFMPYSTASDGITYNGWSI